MTIAALVTAVLILSLAAFVQSVAGFGMALVAAAALPLVMPLREAIALVSVFNLFVCLVTLWHHRREISWRDAWPAAACMCLGIPFGFYFLHAVDPKVVLRVLGGVLLVIALFDLRLAPRGGFQLPRWTVVPLGLTGGVLGGAFNVGGPPVVAWVYSQDWEKARNVAVLQTVFFLAGLTRNGLMGPAGDYTRGLFIVLGWTIVPAAVAIALGKRLLDRVPKEALRRGVFLFVLILGARYLALGR